MRSIKSKSRVAKAVSWGIGISILAGCACLRPYSPPKAEVAPEETEVAPAPVESGMKSVSRAFPTCDRSTSVIMLTKTSPAEINAGSEFEYEIDVENLTDCTINEVTVTDTMSPNLDFVSAAPAPTSSEGQKVVWRLQDLPANATESITVTARADEAGEIKNCLNVSYSSKVCLTANVVEPALQMQKRAPREVLLCDEIPIRITVTNTGTGTARNIRVRDTLPEGLETVDGKRILQSSPFSLGAGESKELNFTAKAESTGEYKNEAEAKADDGLTASASATTIVRQPVLTIEKTAREEQFVGRKIAYTIKVGNKGDAPAENLLVQDNIPRQTSFVSASNGGSHAGGVITWRISSLGPGKAANLEATVTANEAGRAVNKAMAKATCADAVAAQAATEIKGIPAILLEVIDITDPVEVGNQTTYVITATNQGSAPATNVKIVAKLEDSQSYVSSSGDTQGAAEERTITFEPLSVIQPGGKGTWRVTVRAEEVDDARFEVELTSDQLTRPVMETEATNLY